MHTDDALSCEPVIGRTHPTQLVLLRTVNEIKHPKLKGGKSRLKYVEIRITESLFFLDKTFFLNYPICFLPEVEFQGLVNHRSRPGRPPASTPMLACIPISCVGCNEQRREDILNAFETIDSDRSGFVDKESLVEVLQAVGAPLPPDQADTNRLAAMHEAKEKGAGINYVEFLSGKKYVGKKYLMAAFIPKKKKKKKKARCVVKVTKRIEYFHI